MSVLVIQLARFGDIFQTGPALRALRRQFPQEDIHFLVRERFQAAASAIGVPGITIHAMSTAEILGPIIEKGDGGAEESLKRLNSFVANLRQISFGKVINLSFSPFSSYLADALTGPSTTVTGYTRHSDGYLSIPDDASAYFYAQSGVGKPSRYHVTEVFAAVSGVDLAEEDFAVKNPPSERINSIIVHLGASQAYKSYPPELWREVVAQFQSRNEKLILVGSGNERAMADKVAEGFQVENRVGESSIEDLVRWVGEAKLVIGADSAPVHIAALTNTPVLNLSCNEVNFWETGPLSANSRILYADDIHNILPQSIASEAFAMLENRDGAATAERKGLCTGYQLKNSAANFYWQLIQALYTAADYPKLPTAASPLGFHRLFDIAELAVTQLERMTLDRTDRNALGVLQSIDEMLVQLPQFDPWVGPVVAWFQTERLRMGPSSTEVIFARTKQLFEQLGWIAAVYYRPSPAKDLCDRAVELSLICAPEFREFNADKVLPLFQELLTVLQDLGRHTTKVGAADWSSVLKRLTLSLEAGDLIELADILEGDLPQWITQIHSRSETPGQDVIL